MAKDNIVAEDTKSQFDVNVKNKVNKADKPQKLDGEIDVVNKKPHLNATDKLPDYSAATSKDKSKSSKVTKGVGAGEQRGTLNNMPAVNQLKGDATISEEDEADLNIEPLTEEDVAEINTIREEIMGSLVEGLADYIPTDEKPVDMTTHVAALFEGQELSDEFKTKAKTLFEAAVNSEVNAVLPAILEAATDIIMQNEMELVESYDNTINEALSGIAETWMAKNVVGIESRLKTEITEDFIHGLVQLLEDHNIFLPEEKTDVVEEMADRIIELEGQLNEQIEANIQLNAVLAEEMKSQIVEGFAEGLNETEIAKFATLCEGIESNVIDDYEDKVRQIRTSYFTNSGVKPGTGINEERVLTDVEVNAEVKTLNEAAKPVMSSISRFAPRSVKS